MSTNTTTTTNPSTRHCASCGRKSQDTFCDRCSHDHKRDTDRAVDLVGSLEVMLATGHWPDEQPWWLL